MRKIAAMLLCLLLLAAAAEAETVVTSFYPIYLFALNLCDGVEDVTVRNLAAPDFGCLHDYQLTVADMKALSKADVFLINGAGMEEYLTHVYDALPHLRVVDASDYAEAVPLLEEDGDDTAEAEEHGLDHDHEINAHIWMSVSNAKIMVRNLAQGLADTMPEHSEQIMANRDAYLARLDALDETLAAGTANLARRDLVTFHEAFPYFARAYGLNVAAVMNVEPGDSLSAKGMMDLIRLERALGNPPLFTEPQYTSNIAQTVALETGANVYTLDPCVAGPEQPPLDHYERVMLENLETIRLALGVETAE